MTEQEKIDKMGELLRQLRDVAKSLPDKQMGQKEYLLEDIHRVRGRLLGVARDYYCHTVNV